MNRLTVILLFITSNLFAQQPKNTPTFSSQLTNANVYYGYGAELTHKSKVNVEKGQQEIIISNLSPYLDANTLQIGCPEDVVLLSYRFNIKSDNTLIPPNPLIKKMEDSIKVFQKQINANQQDYYSAEEQLTKTMKIVETYTAHPEKTINTTDVIKLVEFYNGKIQFYRNSLYALTIKNNDLRESINDIYTRINELKNKQIPVAAKPIGQMILQIISKEQQNAEIGISYYTQRAGWVPTYDMRVKTIDNSFKLVYKASVSQTTGLDWKQTQLTLSTSNPNLGTNIPILNAWNLLLYVPQVYNKMLQGRNAAATNSVQSMKEVVITGYTKDKNDDEEYVAEDNNKKPVVTTDISNYTSLNESQLFTSYDIDLPYDIPTDGNSYSVTIKEEKINAGFKHYGVPKLDRDAFLLAEVNNWETLDLLPGEANIIMDNTYIGKSFIDPNTTTDTLNISLGRDRRVAVKRTLVKEFSKTKLIGTNKVETFTYEITVKNNKKETVNMLLKDQYPLSQIKEIEVELEDNGKAEVNEELGILNWKVKLEPGEQKKYRFKYVVKYPKDKKIANLR